MAIIPPITDVPTSRTDLCVGGRPLWGKRRNSAPVQVMYTYGTKRASSRFRQLAGETVENVVSLWDVDELFLSTSDLA